MMKDQQQIDYFKQESRNQTNMAYQSFPHDDDIVITDPTGDVKERFFSNYTTRFKERAFMLYTRLIKLQNERIESILGKLDLPVLPESIQEDIELYHADFIKQEWVFVMLMTQIASGLPATVSLRANLQERVILVPPELPVVTKATFQSCEHVLQALTFSGTSIDSEMRDKEYSELNRIFDLMLNKELFTLLRVSDHTLLEQLVEKQSLDVNKLEELIELLKTRFPAKHRVKSATIPIDGDDESIVSGDGCIDMDPVAALSRRPFYGKMKPIRHTHNFHQPYPKPEEQQTNPAPIGDEMTHPNSAFTKGSPPFNVSSPKGVLSQEETKERHRILTRELRARQRVKIFHLEQRVEKLEQQGSRLQAELNDARDERDKLHRECIIRLI